MFIPAPSHGAAIKSDQQARGAGSTEADSLEAISGSADVADRDNLSKAAANARDVKLACRLALRFSEDFRGGSIDNSSMSVEDVDERLKPLRWKSLPESGRCDDKHTMKFHSKEFGKYVLALAESVDRKVVAIRGGWQLAPLAGAGGECLYERLSEDRYQLLGCVQTFVS